MIRFISVFLSFVGVVLVLALVNSYNDGAAFEGYVITFIICGILFKAGFLAGYK